MPFIRNQDGELCPDEAIECHSSTSAAARARTMAAGKAGAVAFSRIGDPDVGDYADAVIIATVIVATVGDVPADLAAAMGASTALESAGLAYEDLCAVSLLHPWSRQGSTLRRRRTPIEIHDAICTQQLDGRRLGESS